MIQFFSITSVTFDQIPRVLPCPWLSFRGGAFQMGGRVTRTPQSGELVRARKLRQALERGASPAFVPPRIPNPATQPSSLSWSSGKTNFEKTLSQATNSGASATRNPTKTSPEETLSIRRQYLEQIFQSSPNPVIITDASFRAQSVNHEFKRMFGYS